MGTLEAVWKHAVKKGLANRKLDKTWQAQGFQFYVGDLANSVPYA